MEKSVNRQKTIIGIITEYLTYAFLIFYFCRLLIFSNFLIINGFFSILGCLIFLLNIIDHCEIKFLEVLVCLSLLLGTFLDIFFIHNASNYEWIWIFCFLGVYLSLRDNILNSKIILSISLIYMITIFLISFTNHDPNTIFYKSSRNTVSDIGIFLLSFYYIVAFRQKENIYKFPAYLLLYCCIWSVGRSAVLVGSIWVFLLLFFNPTKNKFEFDYKILISIIIAILFIYIIKFCNYLLFSQQTIIEKDTFIQHIETSGINSARYSLWLNYFIYISSHLKGFLFGASIYDNPQLYPYGENLHNVLFQLHSKTGLFGFIPVLFLLVRAFIKLIKTKSYTFLFIFLLMGLRSMFDWVGFFGPYDILFYFFMFTLNFDLFNDKKVFLKTNRRN